jgi:hypothetical protein
MIKRLARWILRHETLDQYLKGVKDGVNQMHYEPESAEWMIDTKLAEYFHWEYKDV